MEISRYLSLWEEERDPPNNLAYSSVKMLFFIFFLGVFAYPKFGNLGCPFEGEGVLDNGVSVCQVWESYQSVVHLRGKRRKTLDAADPKHGHVCIVWRHNCIGSCPRLTKQSNPKVRSIFDEPCRPK